VQDDRITVTLSISGGTIRRANEGEPPAFIFEPARAMSDAEMLAMTKQWARCWTEHGAALPPLLICLVQGSKLQELNTESLRALGLARLQ
jgi:hypothetical protein